MLIALSTLIASAQFTVVSNFEMPEDGENFGIDNFTNNIGIGYVQIKNLLANLKALFSISLILIFNVGKPLKAK